MLRHQTKTFAGLVTLACTAALLSLPTESVGQSEPFNTGWTKNHHPAPSNQWKGTGFGRTTTQLFEHGMDPNGIHLPNERYLPHPTNKLQLPEAYINDQGVEVYQMTYVFNSLDPLFGVNVQSGYKDSNNYFHKDGQGTANSLLKSPGVSSSAPAGHVDNFYFGAEGQDNDFFKVDKSKIMADGGKMQKTPEGLNLGGEPTYAGKFETDFYDNNKQEYASNNWNIRNTPWLATKNQGTNGELYDYLTARGEQHEHMTPWNPDEKNPYRRTAAAEGMYYNTDQEFEFSDTVTDYYNNYVVTLEVETDAIFRPNGNQEIWNITPESGEFANNGPGYEPTPEWLHSDAGKWANPLWESVIDMDGSLMNRYSDFYEFWWDNNLPNDKTKPYGTGRGFPWTGIGYTYDWYYQNGAINPDFTWDKKHSLDGYYYGWGVSEFVWAPTKNKQWQYRIKNVETVSQFLYGYTVTPEPTSLTIFGMAALAGLGMHRRRRR